MIPASRASVGRWDTEWAAERAAEALLYLGRNYPECLHDLRVLDEHETAAHEAAMRGDRESYLEALRCYMKAGRDAALRMRGGEAGVASLETTLQREEP
jgi:hypothetical protein